MTEPTYWRSNRLSRRTSWWKAQAPQALLEAGAPVEYRIARRGLFAVAVLDVDLAAVHAFQPMLMPSAGFHQFAEQAAFRHARQVLALADGLAAGLEIRIVGGG